MGLNFSFSSVLLPILELFIQMLSEIARAGFDSLSDARKAELIEWAPVAYILLQTKGKELVDKSATTLDNAALTELLEFLEKLEADGLVVLPHFPEVA